MANSPAGESVISRVARILRAFDGQLPSMTVSSLARRAGLHVATTHRLVTEMVQQGLLERVEDGQVRIGLQIWELASRGSKVLGLRQAAMPFMEDIQAVVREYTQLGVLDRDEVLFLEQLSSRGSGSNATHIAGRLPLHGSSSGIVLLAYSPAPYQDEYLRGELQRRTEHTVTDPALLRRQLAEARRRGYVVAPGSIEQVSTGVAVPVFDAGGQVVAALSVVVPAGYENIPAVIPALQAAARGITRAMKQVSSH